MQKRTIIEFTTVLTPNKYVPTPEDYTTMTPAQENATRSPEDENYITLVPTQKSATRNPNKPIAPQENSTTRTPTPDKSVPTTENYTTMTPAQEITT